MGYRFRPCKQWKKVMSTTGSDTWPWLPDYGVQSSEVVFLPGVTFETMRIRMELVGLTICLIQFVEKIILVIKPEKIFFWPVLIAHDKGGGRPRTPRGVTRWNFGKRPPSPYREQWGLAKIFFSGLIAIMIFLTNWMTKMVNHSDPHSFEGHPRQKDHLWRLDSIVRKPWSGIRTCRRHDFFSFFAWSESIAHMPKRVKNTFSPS